MSSKIFKKWFSISLLCVGCGIFTFQCWALPWRQTALISMDHLPPKIQKMVTGANNQIGQTLFYDPSYKTLKYPGGDVSLIKGVCTDVVIRALRTIDLDLQKLIHEDMKENFKLYPAKWGLLAPDKNIDHRRVPNQQVYFNRKGWNLPITKEAKDYLPGDIVTWQLPSGRDHVGVVTNRAVEGSRPLVVHNIGWGTRMEDVLFDWTITGHYRLPQEQNSGADPSL